MVRLDIEDFAQSELLKVKSQGVTPSKLDAAIKKSSLEPLWYLKSIPYSQYRETHWWFYRRKVFMASHGELECALECELCQIRRIWSEDKARVLEWLPVFHVHHITYERIGEEPDCDLRLLCSSCHNLIHFPTSASAKFWLKHNEDMICMKTVAEWTPAE